jgi:hypothetical protein
MSLSRGSEVIYSVDTCGSGTQGSTGGTLPPGGYSFSVVLIGGTGGSGVVPGDWEATAELDVSR